MGCGASNAAVVDDLHSNGTSEVSQIQIDQRYRSDGGSQRGHGICSPSQRGPFTPATPAASIWVLATYRNESSRVFFGPGRKEGTVVQTWLCKQAARVLKSLIRAQRDSANLAVPWDMIKRLRRSLPRVLPLASKHLDVESPPKLQLYLDLDQLSTVAAGAALVRDQSSQRKSERKRGKEIRRSSLTRPSTANLLELAEASVRIGSDSAETRYTVLGDVYEHHATPVMAGQTKKVTSRHASRHREASQSLFKPSIRSCLRNSRGRSPDSTALVLSASDGPLAEAAPANSTPPMAKRNRFASYRSQRARKDDGEDAGQVTAGAGRPVGSLLPRVEEATDEEQSSSAVGIQVAETLPGVPRHAGPGSMDSLGQRHDGPPPHGSRARARASSLQTAPASGSASAPMESRATGPESGSSDRSRMHVQLGGLSDDRSGSDASRSIGTVDETNVAPGTVAGAVEIMQSAASGLRDYTLEGDIDEGDLMPASFANAPLGASMSQSASGAPVGPGLASSPTAATIESEADSHSRGFDSDIPQAAIRLAAGVPRAKGAAGVLQGTSSNSNGSSSGSRTKGTSSSSSSGKSLSSAQIDPAPQKWKEQKKRERDSRRSQRAMKRNITIRGDGPKPLHPDPRNSDLAGSDIAKSSSKTSGQTSSSSSGNRQPPQRRSEQPRAPRRQRVDNSLRIPKSFSASSFEGSSVIDGGGSSVQGNDSAIEFAGAGESSSFAESSLGWKTSGRGGKSQSWGKGSTSSSAVHGIVLAQSGTSNSNSNSNTVPGPGGQRAPHGKRYNARAALEKLHPAEVFLPSGDALPVPAVDIEEEVGFMYSGDVVGISDSGAAGDGQSRPDSSATSARIPGIRQKRKVVLSPLFVIRMPGVIWPQLMRRSAFLKRMKRFLGLATMAMVRLEKRHAEPSQAERASGDMQTSTVQNASGSRFQTDASVQPDVSRSGSQHDAHGAAAGTSNAKASRGNVIASGALSAGHAHNNSTKTVELAVASASHDSSGSVKAHLHSPGEHRSPIGDRHGTRGAAVGGGQLATENGEAAFASSMEDEVDELAKIDKVSSSSSTGHSSAPKGDSTKAGGRNLPRPGRAWSATPRTTSKQAAAPQARTGSVASSRLGSSVGSSSRHRSDMSVGSGASTAAPN